MDWRPEDVAARIQHTLIRTDATDEDVVRHCREVASFGFDAAMVAGDWLPTAVRTGVKVVSAVDFPVAAMSTAGRVAEARSLVAAGAVQLDVGCKIGWLRSGRAASFRDDLRAVVDAVAPVPVKAMLELALLTEPERELAVELAVEAGVAWVKNASGGAVADATPEAIRFLRARVPAGVGVKASGGIATWAGACALLDAGADLLGTSHGVAVVTR